MSAKKKSYDDFESALERLDEITAQLESGDVKLEDSMKLYSEGVEIAAFCSKTLSETEKKITILKEKNRQLMEESFDGETDLNGD